MDERAGYTGDLFYAIFDFTQLVICVGYPIWRSYKVIEAKKFDNELIQWLTYWLAHALFSKAEDTLTTARDLTSTYLVTINMGLTLRVAYKLVKVLIVLWMIHPKYQGALLLYYSILEKPFKSREP